jgi:hypothetical protein
LFLDNAARIVTDPQQYVAREGFVLLEVPLQQDPKATTAIVSEFLGRYYDGDEILTAPKPKYVLSGRPGNGIEKVRKACRSVARSYRYDLETFEELGHRDAVTAFVRHEIDNMGWTLDPRARQQLAEEGTLSEERLESFKTMLNRSRREFKEFAANTIRASFPDDRPFESDVLDIF